MNAAAARLLQPQNLLKAQDGAIIAHDGRRLGYGELVGSRLLHVRAEPHSDLISPSEYRLIGRSVPRVDIPGKVSGGAAFVQDLRLPDMVHARVVRPPCYHATLRRVDLESIAKMPGVLTVHRNGNYLAVIAEREYQAVAAMRGLAGAAQWDQTATLPEPGKIFDWLASQPTQSVPVLTGSDDFPPGLQVVAATYRRAYQMHGSIGPSCAVALFKDEALTVWSHTQGVYPLRAAIAQLVQLPPDKIRCIQVEGSGCYGHNGADDVSADAALLAMALAGRPVRVQWMREQEHGWEPYGSAMITEAHATLEEGRISGWNYRVRSCTHATRPGPPGNLMPAWLIAQRIQQPAPKPIPLPEGGGDRNAAPLYVIPDARVTFEFVPAMPLRDSTRIRSCDWSSYPIMRFSAVPDEVAVYIVDRPGMPFLGTGEAAQGPTAAAIANAVADATGVRLRDIPLTAACVRAAVRGRQRQWLFLEIGRQNSLRLRLEVGTNAAQDVPSRTPLHWPIRLHPSIQIQVIRPCCGSAISACNAQGRRSATRPPTLRSQLSGTGRTCHSSNRR